MLTPRRAFDSADCWCSESGRSIRPSARGKVPLARVRYCFLAPPWVKTSVKWTIAGRRLATTMTPEVSRSSRCAGLAEKPFRSACGARGGRGPGPPACRPGCRCPGAPPARTACPPPSSRRPRGGCGAGRPPRAPAARGGHGGLTEQRSLVSPDGEHVALGQRLLRLGAAAVHPHLLGADHLLEVRRQGPGAGAGGGPCRAAPPRGHCRCETRAFSSGGGWKHTDRLRIHLCRRH